MSIVKGKARWACVQAPNEKFEPVWSIDLVVDKKTADDFMKRGHKIKTNDDTGELSIKFKRKVSRRNGERNRAPTIVDSTRTPVTLLIGNGSEVNVQYREYDWEVAGKSGKGLDLQGVQVLKLVEFAGADGAEFEAEGSEFE